MLALRDPRPEVDVVPVQTRYALSGDVRIAYQVTGDGVIDLVYVPGFATHLELQWQLPGLGAWFETLGSYCRLIRFDMRGTGLSDRVDPAPTLEGRIDDVRAVMDAAGSERAAFYGVSHGGPLSLLLAAREPHRAAGLVLRGCSPRTLAAPDFPWGLSDGEDRRQLERELAVFGDSAEARAGLAALGMRTEAEAHAHANMIRHAVTPEALVALHRVDREIDVRDVLSSVRAPALLLHGGEDELVPAEAARDLAQRLPSARLVELEGVGHLVLATAGAKLQDDVHAFLTDLWRSGAFAHSRS